MCATIIFLSSFPTVHMLCVLATTPTICSAPQMLALARGLWQVRSQWLDQVILPHLMEQSLCVESMVLPLSNNSTDKRNISPEKPMVITSASDCPYSATKNAEQRREIIGGVFPSTKAGLMENNEHPVLEGECNKRRQNSSTVRAGCGERGTKCQQDRGQCAPACTIGQGHRREREDVDLEPYTERMRAVLRTAAYGLFSSHACGILVELMVSNNVQNSIGHIFAPLRPMGVIIAKTADMHHHGHLRNQPAVLCLFPARQVAWVSSTAQQIHRADPLPGSPGCHTDGGEVNPGNRSGGSGDGGNGDDRCGVAARRWLVDATRYIRRNESTLLLKANGAGLAEVSMCHCSDIATVIFCAATSVYVSLITRFFSLPPICRCPPSRIDMATVA